MPSYWLGIDFGATSTVAAIGRPAADGVQVELVPLSGQSYAMPSVLFLPGDGYLVVGDDAQSRSLTDPYRAVREFKSRMGDEIPLLVGGAPYYAQDLAAEFVSWICQYVTQREGERPQAVALTCPASWGPDRTNQFARAVRDVGVPNVTMLTEPQAAAISYGRREHVATGGTLAVYDLGADRFDVTVLRNDPLDGFTVLGRSEGIAGLGGLSFDEVLFEYVCAAAGVPVEEMDTRDGDLAAEVAQLRHECIEAKEALSASADAIIPVTLGGVQHWVRLTRAEFEEMIRPDLDRTVEAMHRAFGSAEVVASELDAIVLTGGSSRIPLVSRLIAAEFGRPPALDADPKVAVAIGAALFPAPASAPVRDLGGGLALVPLADGGDGRPGGLLASISHPSRKALLAGAALVVLVLGGGVTALTTPALSGLISHHGGNNGTAASGLGPSSAGSGSPVPSAQSSAQPASKIPTATKTAGSGGGGGGAVVPPAGPSSLAAAAAQASNKVTSPGKATKSSKPKPSASASHPATKPPTVRPTTPAPSTTPPTTPTTPAPTPTTSSPTPPTPTSTDTSPVAPSASASTSTVAPSTSAAAEA
ncbi:MAG TPA: Hsp70 family protein [Streptosporangiaceae bacterium]|jgi:actin-like ATPase involved in cell morphogenesis